MNETVVAALHKAFGLVPPDQLQALETKLESKDPLVAPYTIIQPLYDAIALHRTEAAYAIKLFLYAESIITLLTSLPVSAPPK